MQENAINECITITKINKSPGEEIENQEKASKNMPHNKKSGKPEEYVTIFYNHNNL